MAEPLKIVQPDDNPQHEHDVTHVEITRDGTSHSSTTIDGHDVQFSSQSDESTRVSGQWPAEADEHVRHLIEDATAEREKRENVRANKRNLNRMLMLLGALVIGLLVTFTLQSGLLGHWGPTLAPYAFCITILMDSGLSIYAFVKHY